MACILGVLPVGTKSVSVVKLLSTFCHPFQLLKKKASNLKGMELSSERVPHVAFEDAKIFSQYCWSVQISSRTFLLKSGAAELMKICGFALRKHWTVLAPIYCISNVQSFPFSPFPPILILGIFLHPLQFFSNRSFLLLLSLVWFNQSVMCWTCLEPPVWHFFHPFQLHFFGSFPLKVSPPEVTGSCVNFWFPVKFTMDVDVEESFDHVYWSEGELLVMASNFRLYEVLKKFPFMVLLVDDLKVKWFQA